MPHFTRSSSLCSKSQKWNSKISVFLELGRVSDCEQKWKNINSYIHVMCGSQCEYWHIFKKVQSLPRWGVKVENPSIFPLQDNKFGFQDILSTLWTCLCCRLPESLRAPPPRTHRVPSPISLWCSGETHTISAHLGWNNSASINRQLI